MHFKTVGQFHLLIIISLFMTLAHGPLQAQSQKNRSKTQLTLFNQNNTSALRFRNIGPFRGGRAVAVAGHPNQALTFYFGSTGGGLWKTTNGGINWIPIADTVLKTGNVGALCVAPSDPNVIYAGMGESFIRGNMAPGDGLYKSVDAGKTWMAIGLRNTHIISNIVVDPNNPKRVFVAAMGHVFADNSERGIYRSTDGGNTWEKVLYVNEKTGASDIVMDPNNPRILFAGMWEAYRKPWIFSSGGKGSGLYQSTDGGTTWENISQRPGLPKGILGKISISVSQANSNRVYAFIEAKNGGVFRSDDGGLTWSRRYHQSNLTQRAWYFGMLYADPKNEDVVYAPQVSGLFKSVDGGNTFHPLRTPHGDNHVLWINPENPETMIVGNDGGASISYDGGKSWSSENNQPTAQFYHVAVDNQFPYHVYGAQQDNSTVEIMSRTNNFGITEKDWWPAAGGESGYVIPDLQHPGITYGGGYDGALTQYDRFNGQRRSIAVWPDNPMGHGAKNLRDRFQWTFPILLSKHDDHALYVASQYIYKSTNQGESWARISPDLTRNDSSKQIASGGPITKDNTAVEYYNTIFSLAESPVKKDVLWAGSDDGMVHLSTDGGKNWKNVTPKHLPQWTTISNIEASPFDAGTAFISGRRYRQDDFHPYVLKTSDYGKTWQSISKGLPQDESIFVIRQDTKAPQLLFAGTLRGVYLSFDTGKTWQAFQLNLPHVPIRDLAIQDRENDLVVATHGRSFWIFDHLEVLRQMARHFSPDNPFLFKPEHTYLMHGYSFHRPGVAVGENPANGLEVFYYLPTVLDQKIKASLVFKTLKNDTIASFSNKKDSRGRPVKTSDQFYPASHHRRSDVLSTRAGVNSFVWNLRYPNATPVPGAVIWGGNMAGPQVVPGTYIMQLTIGNQVFTQDFEVKKDPRITASQKDLEAQFSLLMQIHNKLNTTNKAIIKIRQVKSQLKNRMKPLLKQPEAKKLNEMANNMIQQLSDIENKLMQTRSHANEDPLNYPVKLNNKLAALAATIRSAYNRPNEQDYQVYKMLASQVDDQMKRLNPILHAQLDAFNKAFQDRGIPAVYVKP
jgi:photosystem II stability/assembly factor-like uncharacterized protein